MAALGYAVDADGEVDVLAIELLGLDEQMRLARFAIAEQCEQALDTIALGCDVRDRARAVLILGRTVFLGVCGRAEPDGG